MTISALRLALLAATFGASMTVQALAESAVSTREETETNTFDGSFAFDGSGDDQGADEATDTAPDEVSTREETETDTRGGDYNMRDSDSSDDGLASGGTGEVSALSIDGRAATKQAGEGGRGCAGFPASYVCKR